MFTFTRSSEQVPVALTAVPRSSVASTFSILLAPLVHENVDLPLHRTVVAGSVVAAPVGVWAAHHLPPKPLKFAFSGLLVVFAVLMSL